MCPLRIILIFLSATLAGFFVLKNLKSPPDLQNDDVTEETESTPLSSKICTAAGKGFWTFVDMASGRYLWRNMISSTASSTAKLSAD